MTKQALIFSQIFALILQFAAVNFAQSSENSQNDDRAAKFNPAVDHHQHLFSPAYVGRSTDIKPITPQHLIAMMDKAGIRRAVVLSTAYSYGRPGKEPANEYEQVKAENDWTAAQVAQYPKRLIGFCGFNPLKDYALAELERCAKNPNIRHGIKMHIGNSDVQLENPEHFEKLKKVFRAASVNKMAIVVHMRASISKQRPYGAEQARLFLELLASAPDVPVQVAHLASAGPGYVDPPAYSVIETLADAVMKRDSRTKNLYFDVASNAFPTNSPETNDLMIKLIRQIGVRKILYGSDAAAGNNLQPRESWQEFCKLNLTNREIKTIAKNVAPYLQ